MLHCDTGYGISKYETLDIGNDAFRSFTIRYIEKPGQPYELNDVYPC